MNNSIVVMDRIELPITFPQALITVDVDPSAERLLIINRTTLEVLAHKRVDGGVHKIIMPMKYATTNDIAVLIFDDDLDYNVVAVDGVQLQIIDSIVTDIKS